MCRRSARRGWTRWWRFVTNEGGTSQQPRTGQASLAAPFLIEDSPHSQHSVASPKFVFFRHRDVLLFAPTGWSVRDEAKRAHTPRLMWVDVRKALKARTFSGWYREDRSIQRQNLTGRCRGLTSGTSDSQRYQREGFRPNHRGHRRLSTRVPRFANSSSGRRLGQG